MGWNTKIYAIKYHRYPEQSGSQKYFIWNYRIKDETSLDLI